MSSGYFSVGIYGQSGLVMDWFGLNDPFTQQIPVKITNNWSGTIWVQGELISPPTGIYTAYSGLSMGAVNSGASATAIMTWNVNVSGQTATSSPVTHALTLGLLAFTSSNYTGALASGNFAFSNTLFNRYSGVIKVFGDIYNNDQPTPTLSQTVGTGFPSGQTMSYAISYILSGWESDIGQPVSITITGSGNIAVTWGAILGVNQYLIFRWSGTQDNTLYFGTTPPGAGTLRLVDLVGINNVTTTFNDANSFVLVSGMFRHRTWQRFQITGVADGGIPTSDTTVYLSPPSSRLNAEAATYRATHGYQLNKNLSGTNLLGPFYAVFHYRYSNGGVMAFWLQNGIDGSISGTPIADKSVLTSQMANVWYRNAIIAGGSGSLSASGTIHLQINEEGTGSNLNIDDVFIVAQS